MYFTGYHGTSRENGYNIIADKRFNLSSGKAEWLGTGIYFYREFSDALVWSKDSTVLHAVIRVEEDEFLDIDSEQGLEVLRKVLALIETKYDMHIDGTPEENQCAVANFIWQDNESIKLISASFATEPTKVKMLIDSRIKRKEFCVRDNEYIKSIQIIEDVMI